MAHRQPTLGEISRRLGAPIHKIDYVVRSRGIEPESIAGNIRIFSEAAVSRIAAELRQIAEDREGGTA
jgi:DNA-binding transcriptional MerR regulator